MHTREHLRYQAAKLAIGKLDAFEIKQTVDSLVTEGICPDGFLEVLESNPPRLDEVREPFARMLRQLGAEILDQEAAVWAIIDHHTARIASHQAGAFEGLAQLISDVYWDVDFHSAAKGYLGDSHGIEHLIGLYWAYSDMLECPTEAWLNDKTADEALTELQSAIQAEAKRWQERYSQRCRPHPG